MTRLDKHTKTHHVLFDENTNEVGSLGDVVEAHAGDAVFLTPDDRTIGGADSGEADFEAEMLSSDSDETGIDEAETAMNRRDLFADSESMWGADQTGTVEGIARGFGTHLPQDLGRGGFHVEEIPEAALSSPRILHEGEELDDYDDKQPQKSKHR